MRCYDVSDAVTLFIVTNACFQTKYCSFFPLGSVDVDIGPQLYSQLSSQKFLNIQSDLHLLFLVTPFDVSIDVQPNWDAYSKEACLF